MHDSIRTTIESHWPVIYDTINKEIIVNMYIYIQRSSHLTHQATEQAFELKMEFVPAPSRLRTKVINARNIRLFLIEVGR